MRNVKTLFLCEVFAVIESLGRRCRQRLQEEVKQWREWNHKASVSVTNSRKSVRAHTCMNTVKWITQYADNHFMILWDVTGWHLYSCINQDLNQPVRFSKLKVQPVDALSLTQSRETIGNRSMIMVLWRVVFSGNRSSWEPLEPPVGCFLYVALRSHDSKWEWLQNLPGHDHQPYLHLKDKVPFKYGGVHSHSA